MTAVAGDIAQSYTCETGKRDRIILCADQTIGAAGAVGTLVADDPGITVAKNAGTGTYDITFPKAISGRIFYSIKSAATTVTGIELVAFDATAGTALLVTAIDNGTNTNPASGDVLMLMLVLETRSDS